MSGFYDSPIEFLKGVGPQRAALLNKELGIFTFADLLQYYPFRYEDRSQFYAISEIDEDMAAVQTKARVTNKHYAGSGRKQRLVALAQDESGELELVWFQGVKWIEDKIKVGVDYVIFGKPTRYGSKINIAHPELEPFTPQHLNKGCFTPVYPLTERLKIKRIDSKVISKLVKTLLDISSGKIRETLPAKMMLDLKLLSKEKAIFNIHFPEDQHQLKQAQRRLKFEEFFYIQLRLLKLKYVRQNKFKGQIFKKTELLTQFYNKHLPFPLTKAQKRVIKEIYADLKSGCQMNRLLQGDVGSGKTIVGFICMLIVIGSGAQCTLMAPTEILAQQHYNNLLPFAEKLGLEIHLLTGSVKRSGRKKIHERLQSGSLHVLVGTHALLEDEVQFKNLGLAIVDEQHRFGVVQRSKLWQKNPNIYPHVLVMTATPIPRTLAMTLYGDLDVSTIDELPKGRKPIITSHKFESHRLEVNGFIKKQIQSGQQVYIVYPLIEESEKLDLNHLMDGYESICRAFPDTPISIVHGKMKSDAKDFEMDRFVKGETKIMVATTVIEVGVDVPNASVMVIENAERFGLSQLHQLRGRVGRGAAQSYCILLTSFKLNSDSKTRIQTMVQTSNGFDIAETDLKLRGPGDIMGTQQSGILDLLIADLAKDGDILKVAREKAANLLNTDPELEDEENAPVRIQIQSQKKSAVNWSRIS